MQESVGIRTDPVCGDKTKWYFEHRLRLGMAQQKDDEANQNRPDKNSSGMRESILDQY